MEGEEGLSRFLELMSGMSESNPLGLERGSEDILGGEVKSDSTLFEEMVIFEGNSIVLGGNRFARNLRRDASVVKRRKTAKSRGFGAVGASVVFGQVFETVSSRRMFGERS